MDAFRLRDVNAEREAAGRRSLEFFRGKSMSLSLYVLPAGATDEQQPHAEDELYYVVSGRALYNVAGEDRPVEPGDVLHVEAEVPHFFHAIEEELQLLVVFAPPKTR